MKCSTPMTKEARQREVARLRREAGLVAPRKYGQAARRRIVELLKLEAGIPDDPSPRRPAEKGPPIDTTPFERERVRTEARQRARRRTLWALGLRDDDEGRTLCVTCGETVASGATGLRGASPWAEGLWHRTICAVRAT